MFKFSNGESFNPYRSRWQGVLNREEYAFCTRYRIPLAYDPAQHGWVALTASDDFSCLSELDIILSDLENELATGLATLLEQVEGGRIEIEDARFEAIERAVDLASRQGYGDLERADKIHSELHREAARYFPINTNRVDRGGEFQYRPWTLADVHRYREILGNPKVWHYLPGEAPTQIDEELAEAMIVVANEDPGHEVFAIETSGHEVVGQVRLLYNQDYPCKRGAEIAYLLGEEHWGKGLMSRVLDDFTGKMFDERHLDFLCAWIRPDNLGSVYCAERSGYSRDLFPDEEKLAISVDRAGFQRYKRYACNVD